MRMSVQPEAIKVPVQMHGGQEDSMKGLSDPEVRPPYCKTGLDLPKIVCVCNEHMLLLIGCKEWR